jgi:glycosyltransferase involved in cell wall biosynthesis
MEQEGFFLPALEAMALGSIVVCPDVGGNRTFCRDGINCFLPQYEEGAIAAAASQALHLPQKQAEEMIRNGLQTAREHSLESERKAYHQILENIDTLWHDVMLHPSTLRL